MRSHEMWKPRWPLVIGGVLVFGPMLVFIFGSVVRYLWNALMPELFGLPLVSFWQALGLLLLSWLLFGGRRGVMPGGHRSRRDRHRGHWARLTPEEAERLASWRRESRDGVPADDPRSTAS